MDLVPGGAANLGRVAIIQITSEKQDTLPSSVGGAVSYEVSVGNSVVDISALEGTKLGPETRILIKDSRVRTPFLCTKHTFRQKKKTID